LVILALTDERSMFVLFWFSLSNFIPELPQLPREAGSFYLVREQTRDLFVLFSLSLPLNYSSYPSEDSIF
jgi:hypothetical protein